MMGVPRSRLPERTGGDGGEDNYSAEYSIGCEYAGPPVSFEIPRIHPVDVRRLPMAQAAARSALVIKSDIPVVQPIASKGGKLKKPLIEAPGASQVLPLGSGYTRRLNFVGVENRFFEEGSSSGVERNNGCSIENQTADRAFIPESPGLRGYQSDNSSHGFNDAPEEPVSRSSEVGDSSNPRSSNSNQVEEEHAVEAKRSSVAFHEIDSSDSFSASSYHDEPEVSPERPIVHENGRKGMCHKCEKRSRFAKREACLVCGAKYCANCVIRAMGSMEEGRKCITCIGSPIDESKRQSLGKCSKMLSKLLTREVINQIMEAERTCEANRPSPKRIIVNGKPLSLQEYGTLQRCPNPPKKLKPGKYWYDKVCGFWGKEGEKPFQIISCALEVGGSLKEDASNGDTGVKINNREITKPEIRMLKAAGIRCEGNPHFWVTEDGSCKHEGMNNIVGSLWRKKRMRVFCVLLSLPYPSNGKKSSSSVADRDSTINGDNQEQMLPNKLLLLGDDQSGTSTIFKQARVLYKVPLTHDEKQDMKTIIQRNLYRYLALLLQGRGILEKESEQSDSDVDPSGSKTPLRTENHKKEDEKRVLAFSPRLEAFSCELTEMMSSGSLEIVFPASTREYAPLVEELWNDTYFQEIYRRRHEIQMLPEVAGYFLEKAIEISRVDYEPSEGDIVHAEGISSSNGVTEANFSLEIPSEEVMESVQNHLSPSYQLIRVTANSLGDKCKLLQLFEDTVLVIFCASLTSYDEYYEDANGVLTNKMMKTKKLFETIVTHPILAEANFLLILSKYDLLHEKLQQAPLQKCDWFQDFHPATSLHPENTNGNNSSPEQKAFHYIAVKFKRLFTSLTERKLFVSRVNGLDSDTVDNAVRYCQDILKWEERAHLISMNDWSESIEQSQSTSL